MTDTATAPRLEIRPSTPRDRLRPAFNRETGMLTLTAEEPVAWPIGLSIGALLVCDLADDGVVGQIELIIPRRKWEVSNDLDRSLPRPVDERIHDVAAGSLQRGEHSFVCDVSAYTNPGRSRVLVVLDGEPIAGLSAVRVSRDAEVLLRDDRLAGISARIVGLD